jgi:hypothetical protein
LRPETPAASLSRMGFRRFTDKHGQQWEIRPRTRSDWDLDPVGDNPGPRRSVRAPGYAPDPFELSQEELDRLLAASQQSAPRSVKNPFKDL